MAKRFIDTTIWIQNKWFRKLDPKHKLLWIYLLTSCDQVGVWEEDIELASILIGYEYTIDDLDNVFVDRLKKINGKKYWIVDFINFQYGVLQEGGKNRPHQSYIDLLKKHRLYIDYTNSIHRDKDKEKDKDKDIDVDISSNQSPTLKEHGFNFDCIKENTQYLESIFSTTVTARKYKLSFPKFQSLTDIFIADQKIKNGIPKNEFDYKDHFVNWMRIQTSKPENWDRKMVY